PYWRLALNSAMAHQTQFPAEIQQLSKMSDEQLDNLMNDPKSAWWHDPLTLIFGKSVTAGKTTDDVFSNLDEVRPTCTKSGDMRQALFAANSRSETAILGGPWGFYKAFYLRHCLTTLPIAKVPQIGVQAGATLAVPLEIVRGVAAPLTVIVKAGVPEGWRIMSGEGSFQLPSEEISHLNVEIQTPGLPAEGAQKVQLQEIHLRVTSGSNSDDIVLRVQLQKSALLQ
ncbi:MAG TPA: hypothetical protein VLX32_02340, partial [Candidatus Acidoferrum sp.]|nr:hypothetical protein [Candidatus Acidoferrum sp.]